MTRKNERSAQHTSQPSEKKKVIHIQYIRYCCTHKKRIPRNRFAWLLFLSIFVR